MSEAIEWCAKATPAKLSFMGTSFADVHAALETAFGEFPLQLERFAHEQVLLGMAAAAGKNGQAYLALLEAVRKFGEIEVRLA
jgi:hypothetical protein